MLPLPLFFRSTRSGGSIQTLGVIPARYQSVRFPGKLLADLGGKPVVAHVIDRAREAGLDRLLVATDDQRIREALEPTGVTVVMTSGDLKSGTDRVAAALRCVASPADSPDDVVVNIQGDEPFIEPVLIAGLARELANEDDVMMGTVAAPATAAERDDPNTVKVVIGADGNALYFSRAAIPAYGAGHDPAGGEATLRHIGLYAYRRSLLERFVEWPAGVLEGIEKLEQLRALERGTRIRVIVTASTSFGIDVPDDLQKARARLGRRAPGR